MLTARRSNNIKPTQPVRVNLGHPMARALVGFYYHPTAGGGLWDAVRGGFAFASAGTWQVTATAEGLALATTTAGSTVVTRGDKVVVVTEQTIICRYRMRSLPATYTPVFWSDVSSGSRDRGIVIGASSTKSHAWGVLSSNGMFIGANNGGFTGTTGIFHTVGVEHHESSSAVTYGWYDGVYQGSTTASGTSAAGIPDEINIGGNYRGYTTFPDVEILWAAHFNKRLSNAEHAWWHRNAFEVLQGRHLNRVSIDAGGGPATLLIAGAQTLDVISQAATATELAALAGGQTLASVTQAATVTELAAIVGGQTLSSVVQLATAAGVVVLSIDGTQTLSAVTQGATVTVLGVAAAAQTLSAITQAGTLTGLAALAGGQTLSVVSQSAASVGIIALLGGQTLTAVTQAATATSSMAIDGAQTLLPVSQAGAVDTGAPAAADSDFIIRVRRRRS